MNKAITDLITIMLVSSVKLSIAGIPMAIFVYDYHWVEALIACSLGGVLGVFVFYYVSTPLIFLWDKIAMKFKQNKKKFTKRNRMIVTIKIKYGLLGIAFLTPILLSVPIGTLLAHKYYRHQPVIGISFLCISVVVWTLVLSIVFYYTNWTISI